MTKAIFIKILRAFSFAVLALSLSPVLVFVLVIGLGIYDEWARPTPSFLLNLPEQNGVIATGPLTDHFPIGMNERELIDQLRELQLVLDLNNRRADFDRLSIVCSDHWSVSWVIDAQDDLLEINGHQHRACM